MKFDSLLTGVLKLVAAVALISLGLITVLLEVALLKGQRHYETTWHWHVGTALLSVFCFCATYLLIRRPSDSVATVYCQRCHTLGGHKEISPYRSSVSGLSYHFGGFLFSIFYSASRKQTFRCRSCGETFECHTATSRAYQVLFLLMLALIVNFLWAQLAEFWNER